MSSQPPDPSKAAKAQALSNSTPLDLKVPFTSVDADYVTNLLYHEMEASGLTPPQAKYAKRLNDHLRLIIYNLRRIYQKDPTRWVSYSLNRNTYNKTKVSYEYVVRITKHLVQHDYVESVRGVYNRSPSRKSWVSRMRAKADLVQLFLAQWDDGDSQGVVVGDTEVSSETDERESVVVKGVKLKSGRYKGKRRVCKTPNTPEVRLMRANLKLINSVMDTAKITKNETPAKHKALNGQNTPDPNPHKQPVDLDKKRLYRVFLDRRLDLGSRFYGPWYQNIKKEERENILINGKPVIEIDYSAFHIHLLYAKEGLMMPTGDPYELAGYSSEIRPFLKTLLLIMINAESRDSVRGALLEMNRKKGKEFKLPKQIKSFADKDLGPVIDKFIAKHKAIERYFNSGYGVTLQYLDSRLAEAIMLYFAGLGQPCLPVHDSFIVDWRLGDELKTVMLQAFSQTFARECPVKSVREEHMLQVLMEIIDPASNSKYVFPEPTFTKAEDFEPLSVRKSNPRLDTRDDVDKLVADLEKKYPTRIRVAGGTAWKNVKNMEPRPLFE